MSFAQIVAAVFGPVILVVAAYYISAAASFAYFNAKYHYQRRILQHLEKKD